MRKLCLLFLLSFSVHADRFVINVAETLTGQSQTTMTEFFTQLYQPIGITPEFVFFPSKRGLAMVEAGELDAEAYRLDLVGYQYPGLIRVDEVIGIGRSGFFCLQKQHCNVHSGSIIAVLDGFESAAHFCLQAELNCRYDPSPQAIAKLLDKGLIHAVLATPGGAKDIICSGEHPQYFFKPEAKFRRNVYHYLNKKHYLLVAGLAQTIRHFRQQGKLNLDKTLQQLTEYACAKKINIV